MKPSSEIDALTKEVEQKNTLLEETKHYFEYILSKVPGCVYWLDTNNIYLGCNNTLADLLGLSSNKEIIGKTNYDLPWKEHASDLDAFNNKVMSLKKSHKEEEIVNIQGKKRTYISEKVPIFDKYEKVIGLVGTSIDITEQKRLESIKDDFISNMQHDIRTPFSGISDIADLFCSVYSNKYPEIKSFSQIQRESCLQWEKVQNDLLSVIDTKQPINIENFYLQDKIDEVKRLLHATAEVRHLDLILEYQCREETGEISSDKLKTGLILASLVGNALNFTEKGSVTVKMRKNQDFFVVDIIDTGIGIPEDKLDYIFEKFSKLNRSNKYGRNFKGVGSGLYRSRRDARKIGGKILVKSTEGVGSTFTVILPVSFNVNISPQKK